MTRRGCCSSPSGRHSSNEAAILTEIEAPIARRVRREGSACFDPARPQLQPRRTAQLGRTGGDNRALHLQLARRVRREGSEAALTAAHSPTDASDASVRTRRRCRLRGRATRRGGCLARRRVDDTTAQSSARKHPLAPPSATQRAHCSCASQATGRGHRQREEGVTRSRTGLAPRECTTTRQLSYAASWRWRTRWRRRRVVQRGDVRWSVGDARIRLTSILTHTSISVNRDANTRAARIRAAAGRGGGGSGAMRNKSASAKSCRTLNFSLT